jgi:hypothetical protein
MKCLKRLAMSTWPVLCFVVAFAALEAAHLWPERQHLGELHPVALVYGAAVLLAAGIGIGLVVGSVGWGLTLVAVVWACLCGASIVKRHYLGSPLYPWDLLRVREVVGIWEDLPNQLRAAFVTAAAVVGVAFAACVFSAFRVQPNVRSRIRRALTGAAVLAAVLLPFHPILRSLAPGPGNALSVALQLRNVRWWPEKNYQVNGFTAGFLISLDVLDIPPPPAGTWAMPADCDPTVLPVRDSGPTGPTVPTVPTAPDVVVLLLESFFDPLTLGIPFSRDPIPFLRELMAQSGNAELHSTFWAHGTANAEFEILTGLSTAFLPPDSVVFFHYLRAPVVSLATELRRAGYRAETVHPNAGWFYSRSTAYPLLGFDRSWFKEQFLSASQARAQVSDDAFFFAKLRERLTFATAGDVRPRFLWGVSLGTHGPYARTRAAKCTLEVGDGAAIEPAHAMSDDPSRFETLRTYACLLERLDRHMSEFVRWLNARGKPVVLFAYGDHLPPLGADLVDGHRDQPTGKFTATPLLMWSNTDAVLPHGYHGGFNFLGPSILRAAGVPLRCQFELLEPLHARIDLIDPSSGQMLPGADPSLTADVNRYWAVAHRLLLERR